MQNETKNTNKTNHNACTNSSDGNNYATISSKRISSIKKAQKKVNKAYAQAIKKNKVAKFTSYSLIEVTGGGTKELITRNSSPSAKGKARNLNFYAYSKGKVKKIWSTSDQAITYNKNKNISIITIIWN